MSRAKMADAVQQILEAMVPELHELVDKNVLSKVGDSFAHLCPLNLNLAIAGRGSYGSSEKDRL